MLAERTPAADRMKPYCEDIVDMPFSSLAMDHLDGLLWRHNFTDLNKEQLAENEDTLIDVSILLCTLYILVYSSILHILCV